MHLDYLSPLERWLLHALANLIVCALAVGIGVMLWAGFARSDTFEERWSQLRRDRGGQSAPSSPDKSGGWYGRQMQPDQPTFSCCGPGDAYWTDRFEIIDGEFYAIITDTRPDTITDADGNFLTIRPHLDPGTRVLVPAFKFIDPRPDPNPSEHGVVWVRSGDLWVYCYVNPESLN